MCGAFLPALTPEQIDAHRKAHEPTPPVAAVPETTGPMPLRGLLERQLESMEPGLSCRALAYMLEAPEATFDLRVSAWADHGIEDSEGIPTAFNPPGIRLNVAACGRKSGACVRSRDFPAEEVPILAEAYREPISLAISAAIRNLSDEVARHMQVVHSIRDQQARIQALKPTP